MLVRPRRISAIAGALRQLIESMCCSPVGKGGWCMKIMVGRSGCSSSRAFSQPSRGASISPWPLPGTTVVERDEAQRLVLDRVVQEFAIHRQVAVTAEHQPQVLAPVVVAGDEVHRHRKRLQDIAQQLVFLDQPAVGEVARGDHHVGLARWAAIDDTAARSIASVSTTP